ncbi:MAG: virB8 family protein [Rickettsiales endosymbiont of Dermacentor nuttalli]
MKSKSSTVLNKLFKKKSYDETDIVTEAKNWYSDRYESVLVQRNILLLLLIIVLCALIVSVFTIGSISASKSLEPFVVEIEDKSGITNVVNPFSRQDLTVDNALNTYFLINYMRARETYAVSNYEYNYRTIVRLYSTAVVYNAFTRAFQNNPKNPITMYGTNNSTSLKVRSIQFLTPGKTAQVRFTIVENEGAKTSFHKIATVDFEYTQMEMSIEDRFINPLGFQITNYVVSDELI